jgi:hypothetical protein
VILVDPVTQTADAGETAIAMVDRYTTVWVGTRDVLFLFFLRLFVPIFIFIFCKNKFS